MLSGGAGMDTISYTLVIEEVSRVCATSGVIGCTLARPRIPSVPNSLRLGSSVPTRE